MNMPEGGESKVTPYLGNDAPFMSDQHAVGREVTTAVFNNSNGESGVTAVVRVTKLPGKKIQILFHATFIGGSCLGSHYVFGKKSFSWAHLCSCSMLK